MPPLERCIGNKFGKKVFELVDHHFPRDSPLRKLFNRNSVKISCSCTKNIKTIISSKNNKLLKPANGNDVNRRECNCRNPRNCLLNGKCLKEGLIYSSKVISNLGTREYIGVTKNTFKERWDGHNFDANHIDYRTRTTLANYIWSLKERNIPFSQTWQIETHAKSYCPEIGYYNACCMEKYLIFKYFTF